jgi:hypothetical protein
MLLERIVPFVANNCLYLNLGFVGLGKMEEIFTVRPASARK